MQLLKQYFKIFLISEARVIFFFFSVLSFLLGLSLGKSLFSVPSQTDLFLDQDVVKQIEEETVEDVRTESDKENCEFYVDVSGAVVTPGVYCMKQGDIVFNALTRAGGMNVDLYAMKFVMQSFNMAKLLEDGEKIYVPFADDVECARKDLEKDPSGVNEVDVKQALLQEKDLKNAICVSINKASLNELMELSGVGEVTAQKIVDARPFMKVEDLMNVSGIGEKSYEKIKDSICL